MKVVLLGDSIRLIGYGRAVPELLGEEFEVWQPAENCRYAYHTLRGIYDWKRYIEDADIIHWNNGLWDVCELFGDGESFTPVEVYVEAMLRVARLLLAITPRVIFATTTPVRPENRYNRNDKIAAYNAAVVPRLRELGVIINELGETIARDIPGYIREDDNIHLTDEGIAVAARQVADCIRTVAASVGEGLRTSAKSEEISEKGAPV